MYITTYRDFNRKDINSDDSSVSDKKPGTMFCELEKNLYHSYGSLVDYRSENKKKYNKIHRIKIEHEIPDDPLLSIEMTKKLPYGLTYFTCIGVEITQLPDVLPSNLVSLIIGNSSIEYLPELPESLINFSFSHNLKLKKINKFPPNLSRIKIFNTIIAELPPIPDSVTVIAIEATPISKLHNVPRNIDYLRLSNTNINELPLSVIWCNRYINANILKKGRSLAIYALNCPLFNKTSDKYYPIQCAIHIMYIRNYIHHYIKYDLEPVVKKSVKKIEDWFLECKYNPKYKYCKKRLMNECEELYDDIPNKKLKKS